MPHALDQALTRPAAMHRGTPTVSSATETPRTYKAPTLKPAATGTRQVRLMATRQTLKAEQPTETRGTPQPSAAPA